MLIEILFEDSIVASLAIVYAILQLILLFNQLFSLCVVCFFVLIKNTSQLWKNFLKF